MTKENQVVTEVREVVSSIRKKIENNETVSLDDIEILSNNVSNLITDYESARESYLAMNSLVMKHEKFKEVIGIIEYASAGDVEILDEAITSLSKVFNSLKKK